MDISVLWLQADYPYENISASRTVEDITSNVFEIISILCIVGIFLTRVAIQYKRPILLIALTVEQAIKSG